MGPKAEHRFVGDKRRMEHTHCEQLARGAMACESAGREGGRR